MKGGYPGVCFRVKKMLSQGKIVPLACSPVKPLTPLMKLQSTSTPLKTRPTSSPLMVDFQTLPVKQLKTLTPVKKRKYVETSCSPHIKQLCLTPTEELTLPLSKEEEA